MTQDSQQPTTISTSNDKLQPPSTSTQHFNHHHTESQSKKEADNESSKSARSSFKRASKKQRGCLCFRAGKAIKVNTCCGVLELSWIKVLAIVGITLNSFTFLVLLALLIFSQNSAAATNIDLLRIRSDLYLYTAWIDAYTLVAGYSQNKTYLSYYYNYHDTINNLKAELVAKLPQAVVAQLNASETYGYSTYLDLADTNAVNMMENGNYSGAVSVLTSGFYYATKLKYREVLDVLLKYILDSQADAEDLADAAVISALTIICVAVAVTVPAIIFIFGFAINREALMAQRYKKARAVELMDTMNNEKLRALFQKHCIKELNNENFEFLGKVTEYKRLVEHQIELVQLLSDGDSVHSNELSSNVSSSQISTAEESNTTTNNSSDSKKKKMTSSKSVSDLENELEEIEGKKFALATEIYNTFLDLKGAKTVNTTKSHVDKVKIELEYFKSKQIHSLSDDLFTSLESEISIVLLDSHYRFKESMEFLKEMRVKRIKDINEKKKTKSSDHHHHNHHNNGH